MHELSVTQSIIDIATKEAEKNNAKRVIEIKIVMGSCTCLVPSIVQDYFDLMSEGTPAHKAKLTIEKVNATLRCEDCGEVSDVEKFRMVCPKCNSRNTTLLTGKEFYIDSMEVEDE